MDPTRRDFLKYVGASSLFIATPLGPRIPLELLASKTSPACEPLLPKERPQDLCRTKSGRTLTIYNTHTGEWLKKITYWENGAYIKGALEEINHHFRDHRNGKIHPIDPKLLDLLHKVHRLLETSDSFHLISGYRSRQTNSMLCKRSHGVAQESQHIHGKAADILIPNRSIQQILKAAHKLKAGGVGGYPHFVHIDTGRVRTWGIKA